jgi:hypothetical protein
MIPLRNNMGVGGTLPVSRTGKQTAMLSHCFDQILCDYQVEHW